MPLEYVQSQKGAKLLKFDGFLFSKEKFGNNKVIWKCVEYSKGCRGRCHTREDAVVTFTGHNHIPNIAKILAKDVQARVRNLAENSVMTTRDVLISATQNVENAVIGQLPSIPSMKKTVQNIRKRANGFLPIPQSLQELNIPEEFRVLNREEFLLFDSGKEDEGRILIFSTNRNLEILSESVNWYGDGTFKTTPPLFTQLYSLHVIKNNVNIPLIYALLPNKTAETYKKLFTALTTLKENLHPETYMADFEKAALYSFSQSFPNATLRGCFFHFMQAIWRKIQEQPQIRERYLQDPDFAFSLKMLPCLAYVPVEQVVEKFEQLLDTPFFNENVEILQPLIDYFEDNWIGRLDRRGRRRPPNFAISLWNCYDAIILDLPKTNNSVEGWHRAFCESVGATYPNIWKFINTLKKEQMMTHLKIEQIIAGNLNNVQRRNYRDCAIRIKLIVEDYNNRNITDYLGGLAHNVNF